MKYRVILVRAVVEDNGSDDEAYDAVNRALENQDEVKDWSYPNENGVVVEAEWAEDAIGLMLNGEG